MALSAAITNLGKYNEGVLDFVWLPLPAPDEEWRAAFEQIGIGAPDAFGIPYEEWFVSDYDSDYEVASVLGEYPDMEDLNEAGEVLLEFEDMDGAADLRAFAEERGLDWESYGLEDVYASDDPALDDLVKEEASSGGFMRVLFFVGQCVEYANSDWFRLDGYGNLMPALDYDERLAGAYRDVLHDVLSE